MKSSVLLTVCGVVQGVGFRPFAAGIAEEMGLSGYVRNKGGFVEILLSAGQRAVDDYIHRLCIEKPFGAEIQRIEKSFSEKWVSGGFSIIGSEPYEKTPVLPPDFSVCEDCLKEMRDPFNRRHGYPFISCTACGPRYSIMNRIPYDRENTVMNYFSLCRQCDTEYRRPTRRRHAQTIACHDCGPQLIWRQRKGEVLVREEALQKAIAVLKGGGIIAVKGIGGYQYLCSPYREDSVQKLRMLKGREKKPFAVMYPNISMIEKECVLSKREQALLESPAKPIVLLEKKKDDFVFGVCGESRFVGAFLPNTPLHVLLLEECGELIVTSANRSGEILCFTDEQMQSETSEFLDGMLYHHREIVTPLDDSVLRVSDKHNKMIRRSRGYVPLPVLLPQTAKCDILAAGGDLKAVFCLVREDRAYLSQYFGDMETVSVQNTYQKNVSHMEQLFHISPKVIACDLHPSYYTVQLAEKKKLPLVRIQHHHAHIASVMAEYHMKGNVLGIAFDGTGYGADGTIWGGEILLCRNAEFQRVGHLKPILLVGGDQAAKKIHLSAYSYLYAAGLSADEPAYAFAESALKNQINTVQNSSMGRLFDAVSYLLGISSENGYEGQAAIALENAAYRAKENKNIFDTLKFPIDENGVADSRVIIQQIVKALQKGVSAESIALGFHAAVADMIASFAVKYKNETDQIALSGGVFANELLCCLAEDKLKNLGFSVFFNEKVPCNDGGITLGQAYICSMMTDMI